MLKKKDGGGIIVTLQKDNVMVGTIGKMLPKNELLRELADMSMYESVDVSIGVIDNHKLVNIGDVEELAEVLGA